MGPFSSHCHFFCVCVCLLVCFTLSHCNGTRNYLLNEGSDCLILIKWMSRFADVVTGGKVPSLVSENLIFSLFFFKFDVSFKTIYQSYLNAVISVIFPSSVFAKPSHTPIFSVIVSDSSYEIHARKPEHSEENLKQKEKKKQKTYIHFPTTCPVW